jgi:hypothetical protein
MTPLAKKFAASILAAAAELEHKRELEAAALAMITPSASAAAATSASRSSLRARSGSVESAVENPTVFVDFSTRASFPEPERGRGKKDEARKGAVSASFSFRRVQEARQVLRESRTVVQSTNNNVIPFRRPRPSC